jgi:catechol 2,3-dioxygenase-like lactoylglutathione lyase family enzyme
MEVKPAYHVAFLVADMDVAIADFEKALGLRFRPPEALTRTDDVDGSPGRPVLSTYSYEGPPYVQLIEAHPTGVYGINQGEGFHHFGVWVDDATECQEVLGHEGLRSEMQFDRGDEVAAWYCNPADLHGIRVEYTGEIARPGVESWLRGESPLEGAQSHSD